MKSQVSEKDIEGYLRDQVKAIGGKAYKFISPGNNGVPDRLIALPDERVVFVETKSPGKKSTTLQLKKQSELEKLGFTVFKDVDSESDVDMVIDYCKSLIKG